MEITIMSTLIPKIEFYAIYNEFTGQVTGVYPDHAAIDIVYKVKIDDELADLLLQSKLSLTACFVDLIDKTVTIIQPTSAKKSYDPLQRIADIKYADIVDPDVIIHYDSNSRYIAFNLADRLKNNVLQLGNNIELSFIVCSYNDPHKIYQLIKFPLSDLLEATKYVRYNYYDDTFSMFTSKIFKKYLIEKK